MGLMIYPAVYHLSLIFEFKCHTIFPIRVLIVNHQWFNWWFGRIIKKENWIFLGEFGMSFPDDLIRDLVLGRSILISIMARWTVNEKPGMVYFIDPNKVDLAHLPVDRMAVISQTIFLDTFSWMLSFVFWFDFTEFCSEGFNWQKPSISFR